VKETKQKKKKKKKTESIQEEQREETKEKKKTESNAEVKKESKKDEYLESFKAEIAKQNLDEATTMLLTCLEKKKVRPSMISDTIELMASKEDFTKLEEICTLTSKSKRNFPTVLRGACLDKVPVKILKDLQLDDQTQGYLRWGTFLANAIAAKSSDITSLFEELRPEHIKYVRAERLIKLVSGNEDSAQKLLNKVIEVNEKDFTPNAFMSFVVEGHDTIAMQLWEKYEGDIDLKSWKGYIKDHDWTPKFDDFAKKHGINLELK